MNSLRTSLFIKKQARNVLSRLYRIYYEEKGRFLSPDEFFPIDLNKVISTVMNWELESVSDIGYDRNGQMLRGRCDYDNKLIRIAFQDVSPAEKNFTIAHEIGHAILHADSNRLSPVSERKRTIRRIANLISTSEERKKEKEANIFAAELLMPEKAVRDYFSRVFGYKEIWLGSMRAQQFIKDFNKKSQKPFFNLISVKDIAPYFTAYKKTGSQPSIREFFGVSTAAMSIRLLELNLIFE